MDGRALLESLADWTEESHSDVSPDARQHNNELMAEFRNELFNLLGSTNQVGGGDGCSGISIVQPIDEELIRQLSPAELEYRLNFAEFGAQTGGGDDIKEAGKKVGFLKKLKIWAGIRNFNKFVDDFEKLRAKINKNMTAYETQLAQSKGLTDGLVDSIKKCFLYEKVSAMWGIMKTEDLGKTDAEKIKFDVMTRRIETINLEIERYKIETAKNNKIAETAFKRKGGWFSGPTTIIDAIKKDVNKQTKAYSKLDAEMNYYVAEITQAKNMKLLEASVAGKNIKELPKAQRREIAEYQKNRAKYEKMFSFDEVRRQEMETLISRKENLLVQLEFYNRTLAAGKYLTKKGEMNTALKTWKDAITTLYQDLSIAITESAGYKGDLKNLSEFIADNTNQVGKLIAGNPDFEVIRKEYEKYLEYAEKAQEYQDGIHNGLCSIKNKILELIPDKVLLQDMWIVSSGQGFVLRLVTQTMKSTQTKFGKNYDRGMRYFDDKIKAMRGGGSTPMLEFGQRGGGSTPMLEFGQRGGGSTPILKFGQQGGVHLPPNPDIGLGMPTHGGAFYDHDDTGRVYDQQTNTYLSGNDTTGGAVPKDVNILTLPYGARRLTDEYVRKLNSVINQVIDDEILYIPLWEYEHTKNIVFILTAQKTENSDTIRVIHAERVPIPGATTDYPGYVPITGNYYFYFPDTNDATVRPSIDILIRRERLNIDGSNYIILPVFYKLQPPVDNNLFRYDEYCLVNPLMPCIMSAKFKESDLTRQPAYIKPAPGAGHIDIPYDIVLAAAGGTDLRLVFTLHTKDATLAELKETDNYDYYYNFCGPEITIKANNPNNQFQTRNAAADAAAGILQPAAEINLGTNVNRENRALFGNYMFQLIGHINYISTKIYEAKLNFSNILPKLIGISFFSTTTMFPDNSIYNILYDIASVPLERIQNNEITKLDYFTKKIWDDEYNKAVFGCENEEEFMYLLPSLKILLADIMFWAKQTKKPNDRIIAATADPNTPIAQKLLKIVSAHAGVPLDALINNPAAPGTAPGAPGAATGPGTGFFSEKQKELKAYLKMAIPQTLNPGSYWKNLEDMDAIINKFSSQEFNDYNKRLLKIYDDMTAIKKFEDKVLDIKPETDKFTLPGVDLIAKNLEVKPPENSKDAYTEAGTKLYEKLKQDKNYIAQNTFMIDKDNILSVLDNVFHKIVYGASQGVNVLQIISNMTEFSMSPYSEYQVYLLTKEGAEQLKYKLENGSKYSGNPDNINKILAAFYLLLRPSATDGGYLIYKDGYNLFLPKLNPKKKNRPGKGKTNRNPKNPASG